MTYSRIMHQAQLLGAERAGEEKSCRNKIKYPTYEAALKAARHHNSWKGHKRKTEPYPCPFCSSYHIGRIMPESILYNLYLECLSKYSMR